MWASPGHPARELRRWKEHPAWPAWGTALRVVMTGTHEAPDGLLPSLDRFLTEVWARLCWGLSLLPAAPTPVYRRGLQH